MVFFFLIFAGGVCVGSFLNCLVYRLNKRGGKGLLWGRSFCPHCQHQLSWYDNIPLLSFIILQGRCRYCHQPISFHYPLVELATGILTLIVFACYNHGLIFNTLSLLLIFYALVAIFLSDFFYQTIPDEIVLPAMVLAIIGHFQVQFLLSGIIAAAFFLFLVLITKGKGMGMGDVKLAAFMGFFLGYPKIVVALYLAFLTGALLSVILILLKKKRFGEEIAFGPFLVAATIISLFFGEKIWQQGMDLLSLRF